MAKSKWTIDPYHSTVEFSVSHLMISKIKGIFENYSADILADPVDFKNTDISFSIQTDSINTRHAIRDGHLKSDLFLDAEKYPLITFRSESIQKFQDEGYHVTGEMTICGVTKTVTFITTYGGMVIDPQGKCRTGYFAQTTIDRKDFGLTYNIVLDAGGVVIGDEVMISISLELIKAD